MNYQRVFNKYHDKYGIKTIQYDVKLNIPEVLLFSGYFCLAKILW